MRSKPETASPIKQIIKVFVAIVFILMLSFAVLIAFISVKEYKPASIEKLNIKGNATKEVKKGETLKVMTWNIGFGALGDNTDFFMDGGDSVITSSKKRVKTNMNAISKEIEDESPDITLIQEIDKDSSRTYHIDQVAKLGKVFNNCEYSYARNYKAAFVPYPMPPLGKMDSGLMTLSTLEMNSSKRVSLPVSFKWPIRTINLKRCLLVTRTKVHGTNKELVYINLHLEAYDKGEGKKAQTKALNKILKQEAAKGNYVIAGGDFNQSFNNVSTDDYPISKGLWKPGIIDISEYDSSLNFVMDSTNPTCRSLDKPLKGSNKSKFQYYVIDGIIYSSNIEMNYCKTLELGFKNSDHNPVVAEIKLK